MTGIIIMLIVERMHSNAVNGIGHALTCMAGRGTGRLSKYVIISGRGSLAVQVLPHAAFPDEQEVPLSVVRPVPQRNRCAAAH